MVQLAVVPPGAVGLLEMQHRNVVQVGEPADVTAETSANLVEQNRRRNRVTQMLGQEPHHLAGHLKASDIGVQVQPSTQSTSKPT